MVRQSAANRSHKILPVQINQEGSYGYIGQVAASDYTMFWLFFENFERVTKEQSPQEAFASIHAQRLAIDISKLVPWLDRPGDLSWVVREWFKADDAWSKLSFIHLFYDQESQVAALKSLNKLPEREDTGPRFNDKGEIMIPPKPSGHIDIDLLAIMTAADGIGLKSGLHLLQTSSVEYIETFLKQLERVQEDPDVRRKKHFKAILEAEVERSKREDKARYHQILGLEEL